VGRVTDKVGGGGGGGGPIRSTVITARDQSKKTDGGGNEVQLEKFWVGLFLNPRFFYQKGKRGGHPHV